MEVTSRLEGSRESNKSCMFREPRAKEKANIMEQRSELVISPLVNQMCFFNTFEHKISLAHDLGHFSQ